MSFKTYQKKPVRVEAWQLTETNGPQVASWVGSDCVTVLESVERRVAFLFIPTLEGTMRADIGDYIIKGVRGEFYPCKPDIFAETYEEVSA